MLKDRDTIGELVSAEAGGGETVVDVAANKAWPVE
jgi:hypothetical protein